jgi:hypothetical protein
MSETDPYNLSIQNPTTEQHQETLEELKHKTPTASYYLIFVAKCK